MTVHSNKISLLRFTGLLLFIFSTACSSETTKANGSGGASASANSDSSGNGGTPPIDGAAVDAGIPLLGESTECYLPQDSALIARYGAQELCLHNYPKPDCEKGWCQIPKGKSTLGVRPDAWTRWARGQDEVEISFSHDTIVMQYELTRAQWAELVPFDPSIQWKREEGFSTPYSGTCVGGDCPLANLTLIEAMHYANLRSAAESLEACYAFSGCTGDLGKVLECEEIIYRYASVYDCPGYRLPTAAEGERLVRAGSRMDTYAGNTQPEEISRFCTQRERSLEEIAWYCGNSGDGLAKEVGQKLPNALGLFDTIGNISENTSDTEQGDSYFGRERDPQKPVRHYSGNDFVKGDLVAKFPGASTFGVTLSMSSELLAVFGPNIRVTIAGVRLVRTTSWEGGSAPAPFLHHGDGVALAVK